MPTIRFDAALISERPGAEESAPKWNHLLPLGVRARPDFPGGKLEVTVERCQEMVRNWEAEGRPERPVNYFHRGSSDGLERVEDKVAAGWVSKLEARADGLWGLTKWNRRARQFFAEDELRYVSAEINVHARNKATGKPVGWRFLGVAVLNDPEFTELPRVAAAAEPAESATGGVMPLDKARICAALGLSAEASDDDVYAKLEGAAKAAAESAATVAASAKELNETKAKLSAYEKAETEAKVKLSASEDATVKLSARVEALEKQNTELVTERQRTEHKAFFDGLVRELKLEPGERPEFEKLALSAGLEAVKFLEKRRPFVATGELGSSSSGQTVQGSAEEARQKFNAAVADKQGKGLSLLAARQLAKAEMPDLYKLAMTVDDVIGFTRKES